MTLTKRQTEITYLLAQGHTAEQCAAIMHRSVGTVRRHIGLACERVKARNTAHLVAIAITEQMIRLAITLAILITAINPDADAMRHNPITRTQSRASASRTLTRRDTGSVFA